MKLLDMMGAVDLAKVLSPTEEVGADHAVGVMGTELQKLYGLFMDATKKHSDLVLKARLGLLEHQKIHLENSDESHDCDKWVETMVELSRQGQLASAEYAALNEIFWNATRLEFPELLGKGRIGVRKDFTLVWVDKKKETGATEFSSLGDLLESLFSRA